MLGAAVDLYLLGKPNISWGSGGAWRNRGRATQKFSLREEDEILRAGAAVITNDLPDRGTGWSRSEVQRPHCVPWRKIGNIRGP